MKLLIVANNIYWETLDKKVKAIKAFYAPVLDLEIDILHTAYKNIPFAKYPTTDGTTGVEKTSEAFLVNKDWYKLNISDKAKGYQFVELLLNQKDIPVSLVPQGVQSGDEHLYELTIFGTQEDWSSFVYDPALKVQKNLGDSFVLLTCHEISHALYKIYGLEDKTHEHFYSGYPEKVLEDFKGKSIVTPNRTTLKDTFRRLFSFNNQPTVESLKLYQTAKNALGQALSPKYTHYGCAEAVNNVSLRAFGEPVCDSPSTMVMYQTLLEHPKYVQVYNPVYGDIIISPTGYGNGKISNGHVGILGKYGIMSNSSVSLKWELGYNMASWKQRYQNLGGYPIYYFRKIS